MTPDINCEADVKHPKKRTKRTLRVLRGKIFENSERHVTGRMSLVEILKSYSIKDMLVKLMFKGNLNRKLIIFHFMCCNYLTGLFI